MFHSAQELSYIICQYTHEPIKQIAAIGAGIWQVQLTSGRYVVKIRRSRSRLLSEQKVLQSLRDAGVQTEQLLNIWPVDGDHALCRFTYMEGAPLLLDMAMTRAEDVGRQIGALHQGLATVAGETGVPVGNLTETILHLVVPALVQTGRPMLMALTEQLLGDEDALWNLQELPRQLIHRDAHIGNMLFGDTAFVGWVDFDRLETNFRLFDVCYCAAGLLAARFTDPSWRNQWITVVREMVHAYSEAVGLAPAEVEAVWIAMVAIEALFVGISAQRDLQAAERTAAICSWLYDQRHQWRL